MEEIEILKFILTMDSTDLLKGLSKSDKAFENLMDVFVDFGKEIDSNDEQLKKQMKTFGKMEGVFNAIIGKVKSLNKEMGEPLGEGEIDKFSAHLKKSFQSTTKEANKLQKQFQSIQTIKPKIDFDIKGLEKAGANIDDIVEAYNKLYSGSARTTTELKQQQAELSQLITMRKAEINEVNSFNSAYRKAKMEQVEMAKRFHDIEGKAFKEGVSDKIEPALKGLLNSYKNFFDNIESYSGKQINEMMQHLKAGIGSVEKEIGRATKASKEAFQKEQMATGSASEARKYSALAGRVKPEIMTHKGMSKDAMLLEEDLKHLALKFELLRKEMALGIRPAAELEREFKRLQSQGKQLNDVFKEQKAVVKQAVDEFQNQRKRMYDIANIGESMMMQAGLIGGAFALMIKEFTGAFLQFEEVYNRLRGVSFTGDMEALNTQSQKFKDTAQEVAGKTSFMAHEITQAGVAMVKVGFTLDQTTQSIEGIAQAAEASGESMETVAETVSGVINAFGLAVSDTQMVIDTLTRGAIESAADIKSLGETLKYVGPIALATSEAYDSAADAFSETAAMATFLGKNMVLGSQAGTTLRQMLIRLTKVTPEAKAVMDALNVSFTDSNGKMKKQSEFLIELSHALENVTPSMRNMALATIFGERAITGTSAALNQISKDEYKFRKTIQGFSKDASGMTKQMQEISFTGLTAEVKKFLASFDALKVSLGETFSVAAKPMLAILRSIVDTFNSFPTAVKATTVVITVLGAAIFGMVAIGGALIKMYASWNQAVLFLSSSQTLLKGKIDSSNASIATQTALVTANTRATNLSAASAVGMLPKITGVIGKFGAWGLAISGVITLLISLYNWSRGYSKELESKNLATASLIELDIKRKELKKEVIDLLKKEREGVILLYDELNKLNTQAKLDVKTTEKQIKDQKKLIEILSLVKEKASGGGIGKFLTDQDKSLLKSYFPQIEKEYSKVFSGNFGISDSFTEGIMKVSKSVIPEIDVALEDIGNRIDSNTKKLEHQGAAAEKISDKTEIAKKYKDANDELEKQRAILDQLYALHRNVKSEENRKKIQEQINIQTQKYIVLLDEVKKAGKEMNVGQVETLDNLNKRYEIQDRLNELSDSSKKKEQDLVELLQEQNKEREYALDLAKRQQEILNLDAYARTLGVDASVSDYGIKQRDTSGDSNSRIEKINKAQKQQESLQKQETKEEDKAVDDLIKSILPSVGSGYSGANTLDSGGGDTYNPQLQYSRTSATVSKLTKKQKELEKKGKNLPIREQRILDYSRTQTLTHYSQKWNKYGPAKPPVYGPAKPVYHGAALPPGYGLKDLSQGSYSATGSPSSSYAPNYGSQPSYGSSFEANKRKFELKSLQDAGKQIIAERKSLADQIKNLDEQINSFSSFGDPKKLQEIKDKRDELYGKFLATEEQFKQNQIKLAEDFRALEEKRKKERASYLVELLKLDQEYAEKFTQTKVDDIETEFKLKTKTLELEKIAEKKVLDELFEGTAEYQERLAELNKKFSKKTEILSRERQDRIFDYSQQLEKEMLELRLDYSNTFWNSQGSSAEKAISMIESNYQKQIFDIQQKINKKKRADDPNKDEIKLLEDKIFLLKQIQDQETSKAKFQAEMTSIENMKTYISLAGEKDHMLKQMLSVTSMISNIENEIATKGLVDSVSEFQKIGETFKSINTEELINTTNSALDEQNNLLKKQIQLIDETDISKLNDEEFNELLKKRNDLEIQLINNAKTQNLLSSDAYLNWRKASDELDRMRGLYNPINNAASEFAKILKDTPFGSFADAVNGATELGVKIFDLTDKAKDLPVIIEKATKSAGTKGGDLFSGLASGGMSLTGAGIGAALADPTMISALLALAPIALDIAKTIGGAIIDGFFPGTSRAAREFKRNITGELISAREDIDKELLARGDISKYIFNERRLEDAAVSYSNKLTQLEDDIWDKSMDVLSRNAAGLISAGIFENINPFGWLFGMFTENDAEKQFREEIAKIEEYADLMREKIELEQEKLVREIKADQKYGSFIDLFNLRAQGAGIALMQAQNFGTQKDEIKAEYEKTLAELDAELIQAQKDFDVDLDENKFRMKEVEIETKRIAAKKDNFERLNNLRAEQKIADNNHLDRLAQVNNKLGDYAKQEISIRTNLANQLIEVERKIAEARNRGDTEAVSFLTKEKGVIEAEGLDAIQRGADEARKAFVDFNNELAQVKAKMTSGGQDDALANLDTELGNIQDKVSDLTRKFPGMTDKIEALQAAMIKSAFRTYNEAVLGEESGLLGQERGILAKSFLLEGNDLEAAKQDMRNQAQELIDELEIVKLLNAGDESDQTRRMIENKEKMTQQAIAEIALEGFKRLADLRQQDLNDYLEVQKLKAENAFDPYGVVSADTQSQLNAIAFEKYIAQQTIKNQEKLNNKLALLNEQEKKLRREGVENAASAAIDELNRIKDIREQILEDATKTYELDIKKNQREIDLMQREVDVLQRKKDQIQRDIEAQQKEFNRVDKTQFQDFWKSFSVPQEVMDTLEYISNPLANKYTDASYMSVLEGIQTESDIGKRTTEVAYALEDINTQEYYEELKGIAGNQAAVAQYALSLVEDQQQAELDRLRAKGATEGEIMLMEKRQLDEKLEILEFYAEAYEDYQNAELGLIEARHEKELELNDDLIQSKEDGIQALEWANEDLQWKIDELSMAAQKDYDLIDEKVRKIEESTRNWGFTTDDVMTRLPELVANVGTKFDELRGKIEAMKGALTEGMPNASELGAQLAAQNANKFSDLTKSPSDMDIGQWREQHYYGTSFANQTDEVSMKPPSRDRMTTTDPEGWFTIQSDKTGKWYRTNTEMGVDEQLYAMGMSQGGMAGVTRNGLNGARDYIPVKARDKELFAPIRDFRSFAQDLTHRALIRSGHGGYAKNDVNLSMSFGNVYGVDDLIGTIDYAIKKSNKELGYYNAPYTSGNT